MALTRLLSSSTYQSQVGQSKYTFVVQVDGNGLTAVRDIRGPNGLVQDPFTTLPAQVVDDIYSAKGTTNDLLASTALVTASLTFVAQTTQTVTFVTPLDNANYRVALTFTPVGPVGYITNQTGAGFTIVLSSTYTGVVGYVVFQKASSASGYSGAATFVAGSLEFDVLFSTATQNADYRVVLTPNGFFPAAAINKTVNGFTVQLGIGLVGLQTASVGFDVFV
jgi:hypothetical protein